MGAHIIRIVLLLPLVLLLAVSAHAQPELRVGQEVEIYLKSAEEIFSLGGAVQGYGFDSCQGVVKRLGSDSRPWVYIIRLNVIQRNDDDKCYSKRFSLGDEKDMMLINARFMFSYRILNPAPRPGFKLPSEINIGCGYERGESFIWMKGTNIPFRCFAPNDEAIADELRYLRKEVEALRK